MTREVRSVFLAILTLLVYTGMLLIDYEVILFPFPLNETVFLIVATQFAFWNFKSNKLQYSLILATSLLGFISAPFVWSFISDLAILQLVSDSALLDVLKLANLIVFITWLSVFIIKSKVKYKFYYYFTILGFLLISVYAANGVLETIAFSVIAFYATYYKPHPPIYLLWILYAFLQLMKTVTLYA